MPGLTDGAASFATLLLSAEPGELRTRRAPGVWSAIEYACHVRDTLLVQRERVLTALRIPQPTFEPMGREERVVHDGYAEQAPTDVARQIGDAALMFTNVLDRLDPAQWQRTLVHRGAITTVRSMRWVAAHSLHEVQHHLQDAERQLA
ncbi:hypothetical protein BJF78_19990 [Pseudonocardia sp. CNS-139]|nr:hypothetical protein BJF78_19990 [Pseudonocardia sp. CNS-139]